ncbi:MAG: hypothetical protein KME35_22475 [Aphanocapsa sp. GSE-SYN-MK-11-07L]|jgi:hypothetical protein|nr:hypothetical protein [Aphanocapsa sp. GSE-SYN-MK-11-07L]
MRYLRTSGLATGIYFLWGLWFPNSGWCGNVPPNLSESGFRQPQATASLRIQQKLEQQAKISPDNYDLQRYPLTDANERHWRKLLWATAVVSPQEPSVTAALSQLLALTNQPNLSRSQVRTLDMAMQVSIQLYLSHPANETALEQRFLEIIESSPEARWVAMSLSGLAKAGMPPDALQRLSQRIYQRFPQGSEDLVLQTTLRDIADSIAPPPVPPLQDLFNWTIAPGQPQLYVICQSERQALCISVLKNRQGRFLRLSDATAKMAETPAERLWMAPLYLQSIHRLAWNFHRGETPQGIYRIEGIIPQPDSQFFRAYGQFPLINLFVPFESGVREFLPGRRGAFTGTLDNYLSLLPPSWRQYRPIQQTYWAGKIGRGLFRIHGSGESPEFFAKTQPTLPSYNWNPTLGCLSALELYDATGKIQRADMPKILNALRTVGGRHFSGYLVVVEIPSDPQALESDIEAAIANF